VLVVKFVVVANELPPLDALYQSMEVPVADKSLTLGVIAEQNDCDALPVGAEGAAGCAFTVALLEATDEQEPY
jgi:hypothetical protein